MKKIIHLTVAIFTIAICSEAQEKEMYFKVEEKKIESIGEKFSKNEVVLNINPIAMKADNNVAAIPGGAIATFLVTQLIIPHVFNNISTLFYNPKKYIKENNATYSFIDTDQLILKQSLRNYKSLSYTKIIYDSETTKGFHGVENAIEANFNIHKVNDQYQSINLLELVNFNYNYTNVKLKSSGKKVNLVLEISVNYINNNNEIKTLNLQPIKLNDLIPDGSQKFDEPKKKTFLVLQNLQFIQSINIKATEINARKKDMDKWLELYINHKDKIQSFTIDQLD